MRSHHSHFCTPPYRSLPFASTRDRARRAASLPAIWTRHPAVLVLEHEPIRRAAIGASLVEAGLATELAADTNEALAHIATYRPGLLLLDPVLVYIDGEMLVDELHARYGDTVPIVLLSGDPRGPALARRWGACALLVTLCPEAELVGTVRQHLPVWARRRMP